MNSQIPATIWEKFVNRLSFIISKKGNGFFTERDPGKLYEIIYSRKYTCKACGGSGNISAKLIKNNSDYSFRCACDFGKFLRWSIPQWSADKGKEFKAHNNFYSNEMRVKKI